MLVSHRCSKHGLSIANRHYDVVNAFASPSHDIMDQATQYLMLPQPDDDIEDDADDDTPAHVAEQDERLLRQHRRHSTCVLQTSDVPAEFYPRSGTFQGNSVATSEFHM
eukprot:9471238-Pyramimonas_sp.AAC.1